MHQPKQKKKSASGLKTKSPSDTDIGNSPWTLQRMLANKDVVQPKAGKNSGRPFTAPRIQRALDLDERIEGLFPGAARFSNMIFFDYASSAIDPSEQGKIAPLAVPVGRDLTLYGRASEEGSRSNRTDSANDRIASVDAALSAAGHTGTRTAVAEPDSGLGFIDYRKKRHVEVVPTGGASDDVDCSGTPVAVDCNTIPEYANFATRLTDAEDLVQGGIDALNADRTPITGLLDRFFGDHSSSTGDELRDHLVDLKDHIHNYVSGQHECHNDCDPACGGGSTAYNSDTGPDSEMVFCNRYFADTDAEQVFTLIHESVHGTRGMADAADEHSGAPDFTYRWARLFGRQSQAVVMPTADALRNPDSLVFFLREIETRGSTTADTLPDDTMVGMNSTQEREAYVALSHAQWWLIRDRQLVSQVYGLLHEERARSSYPWSSGLWVTDIVEAMADHFGTARPPAMPGRRDRYIYAAVHDRIRSLRWSIEREITMELGAAATTTWDGSTQTLTLRNDFFGGGLTLVDQIRDIINALAAGRADISSGLAAQYGEFCDKVRQTDNVAP